MKPILDPRRGDIEDDASSTKSRSLLSIAGALLVEISLPKLLAAWLLLIVVPGLALGLAPILASIWFSEISGKVVSFQVGIWPVFLLAALVGVASFGARRLFRLAESNFWSLNALAVQPIYAICREAFRQLVEQKFAATNADLSRLRAAAALISGLLICGVSLLILWAAWPHTLFMSGLGIFHAPRRLAWIALANSTVLVSLYVAAAALIWAIADATMDQPHDLASFDPEPAHGSVWRVAHLSDVHVVGERYGFRIESGRSGPRGNERLKQVFVELEAIHARERLDAILITGDVTDAGLSAEWAEFFDLVAQHPALAELILMAPGNHDLNIVDRSNPARLDLPTSPYKRLRKLRVLSALATIQGERVQVVNQEGERIGDSLAAALAPHRTQIETFTDAGTPRFSRALSDVWNKVFPLVRAPDREDGLGFILLNSNADTHFSFTNALGMISLEQSRAVDIACAQYPKAHWVIGLHHHLVEYPRPAKEFSERIGTALINGNWFARHLQTLADRAVVLHGHRHVDWIGECGDLRIVSAPSPVMEAKNACATSFYIHRLSVGADGRLKLRRPEKIVVAGLPDA